MAPSGPLPAHGSMKSAAVFFTALPAMPPCLKARPNMNRDQAGRAFSNPSMITPSVNIRMKASGCGASKSAARVATAMSAMSFPTDPIQQACAIAPMGSRWISNRKAKTQAAIHYSHFQRSVEKPVSAGFFIASRFLHAEAKAQDKPQASSHSQHPSH